MNHLDFARAEHQALLGELADPALTVPDAPAMKSPMPSSMASPMLLAHPTRRREPGHLRFVMTSPACCAAVPLLMPIT